MSSIRLVFIIALCLIRSGKLDTVSIQLKDFVSGDLVDYSIVVPCGYQSRIVEEPNMYWGNIYSFQFQYKGNILFYFGNLAAADSSVLEQVLGDNPGHYRPVGNYFLLDTDLVEIMNIPNEWDLAGKDKKNRYWRDVECFSWTIGYKGVPKRYLSVFDTIIDTFVQKYKDSYSREANVS